MKKHILNFIVCTFIPGIALAAPAQKCSVANLNKCLDSACAINLSTNPSARCQYCGTSSAGTPPTDNGMRSVSVGTSAKYSFTDKELKKAPSDPGERYAWATRECITKVAGCTPDDVTDNYDKLIEQSCTAAGISAQMNSLQNKMAKPANKSACNADILSCIIDEKHCGPDYASCKDDADFNKFFAACSVQNNGCDDYITDIRTEIIATRDNIVQNTDNAINAIAATYKNTRDARLQNAKSVCDGDSGRQSCITSVCERSMANKCAAGFEAEKSMATQLCKFYDLACAVLK